MSDPAAAAAVIAARGVTKRLRRRLVLDGVDVVAGPGEMVGISGENGAGKSTLLRILAGLLRPDRGTVRRPASLGYAPQLPLLYRHLTVLEHFRYVAAARRLAAGEWERRAAALMERYRFADWAGDVVAELSEGTKQKLNLALALLPGPAVLLLDEPYGGFEWETYLRFWDHARELRDGGGTLIVVSHLFHDRVRLDRILELRHGRLAA
jgi:ABC-2 type transport system ATP-binding protein